LQKLVRFGYVRHREVEVVEFHVADSNKNQEMFKVSGLRNLNYSESAWNPPEEVSSQIKLELLSYCFQNQ
jgi:hypothetical protein